MHSKSTLINLGGQNKRMGDWSKETAKSKIQTTEKI